jgi:GNAT superfamily N-acetyltransferase
MLPEALRPSAGELRGLPGDYGRPSGRLLLARIVGEPAGCVALRALRDGDAEMKRLYVRDDYRGMGVGRMLAEAVIDEARGMGYRRLLLDTLPTMDAARAMYASLGFAECAAYNDNPVEGVRFMALAL